MDPKPPNQSPDTDSILSDIRVAISLVTRLPVGAPHSDLAAASWAFPVAGLVVGLAGGGLFSIALAMGIPALAAALLAFTAMAVITGALHEDGLADTADGIAGENPERRLEIMRDSRIGAYGVLALVFSVGLRAAAIEAISDAGLGFVALVAAATLSRGLLPGMMHMLPLASPSGLAAGVGQPTRHRALAAAILGTIGAIAFLGFATGIGVSIIAIFSVTATALLARHMIGGYNGDTLGAAQQVAEIAILVTISTEI